MSCIPVQTHQKNQDFLPQYSQSDHHDAFVYRLRVTRPVCFLCTNSQTDTFQLCHDLRHFSAAATDAATSTTSSARQIAASTKSSSLHASFRVIQLFYQISQHLFHGHGEILAPLEASLCSFGLCSTEPFPNVLSCSFHSRLHQSISAIENGLTPCSLIALKAAR